MPLRVGDRVRILSDSYYGPTTQGLKSGDIAEIASNPYGNGGSNLIGLPGTNARENYPTGLYFRSGEFEPVDITSMETDMNYEWEGKYFRETKGWIVGPLVRDGQYAVFGNYRYRGDDLTSIGVNDHLIPEAVDLGEPVEVNKVEVGDCVLYRGKFWWVTRKDSYDDFLVTFNDSLWMDRRELRTTYPNLRIEPSNTLVGNLKGKWVWHVVDQDYLKVEGIGREFKNPLDGFFNSGLLVTVPGSGWKFTVELSDLDLTNVVDQHPWEATMVRSIQGEGKYFYAVSRKDPSHRVMVTSRGYHEDYGFYNIDTRDSNIFNLAPNSSAWWQYQVFATDTPPDFGLPFSWEVCVESLTHVMDNGYNELQRWLLNNVGASVNEAILRRAKMASNTRGNIALYLTEKQIETQKIQSLRPGKALRVLIPSLTDAELEKLVDKFRKDFPTGDYVIKRGIDAADFKRAYSGSIASMQNPNTSHSRKSLANSCMRHDFSHLKHHPAEAYASGEFEMLWTETPDGKIGSRMVVWNPPEGHRKHGTPQCGPVYGTCEYSMDLLEGLMRDADADLFDAASWVGAKLQRLNKGSSEVFLPYIDNEQGLEVYDDYLEITDEDPDDCSVAANNTCGYVYIREGGGNCCACCGNHLDEYDTYGTDDGDMCESCYESRYFRCEEYDEVYRNSEMCTAYRMERWGATSRYVCEDARDSYYTLCEDGNYWHNDDILVLADGRCLGGDSHHEAAECIMTNEYYLLDDLIPTVDGDFVSKEYYNNHKEEFTMNEDGELQQLEEAA